METPTPSAEVAAQGVTYHTLHGREAQVTFTSSAPLENIIGKSNAVVGYTVRPNGKSPADLIGGQWELPVRSLATGIPLRDQHIAAKEWFDANAFPTITFKLKAVEDIQSIKSGDGFSTWSVTFVGDLTLHGVTRELRIADVRLSFLDESERTQTIAPGDLLFIKCAYVVKMSDFGVTNRDVPEKVSDEIQISQLLRLSTTPVDSAENLEELRDSRTP